MKLKKVKVKPRALNKVRNTFTHTVREVCRKSKWKFKMAFAMKGGGGLEGVSFAIKLF